ncbi:MAG TPA: rRNA adenine N(6)-methyltransferase family protein, partial [Gaiellales bacterium]|nr:rRNA adenine N(6)-methyltransferase family protein [Gaiellales bacterium]
MSGVKRRHTQRLASGQHLLRSPLADELAAAAGVAGGDLVVEIGAGTGRLTAPLAERAGHVIAIEVDPRLARQLRRRFQGDGRVTVVEADGLAAALPQSPFRVVSNLPFAITTPMLRRLLDGPGLPLRSADLVVQRGFAVKRCSPRPCTLLSAGWLPWWQLGVERVLPPDCFQPPPSVESAILSARRRPRPG